MTIDERLEALTQSVELIAAMQQATQKQLDQSAADTGKELKQLTRDLNRFRHFVLSMGANLNSRVLNLETRLDESDEG